MHYIILDLEWNQPLSWQSPVYREIGDRLIFEMIQIGAVRLDDDLNITEALSLPIAPTHYLQIHPRIRRMTGLGQEELAGAPAFREALEQFSAWCGEDYVLLTWGCDDVSVLQQNIDFFGCRDIPLAPLCDIQKLFAEAHQLKDRPSLQKAMELTEIRAEEGMAFHNARNDAWYTALVFRTLPDPAAVLTHQLTPKSLIHKPKKTREKIPMTSVPIRTNDGSPAPKHSELPVYSISGAGRTPHPLPVHFSRKGPEGDLHRAMQTSLSTPRSSVVVV